MMGTFECESHNQRCYSSRRVWYGFAGYRWGHLSVKATIKGVTPLGECGMGLQGTNGDI